MIFSDFVKEIDKRLDNYFKQYRDYICCKEGCSYCCENGDYPLSETELMFIMQGFAKTDNETKRLVQENISKMSRGGACPFLINKKCSIYEYRPIICRVHGLAYICKDNTVKLPYCVNLGLNFKDVYKDNIFLNEPIKQNLDTSEILKGIDYGEVRNMYDWIHSV